ncbi:MAG: Unknown protein [uncultured Thiotrichaceae bacterium]|uniref:Transcription factor LuxR-like autoinducer-binding domain-containing protein n=1 Tax=uncultured Thiotrichaceae bacterium TaxID=298394 RepID=A0A6S6T484_9GAMM|nr:MAG: Unknown protein [uncultured Thiotrichaceae bacterium]
MTDFSKDLGKFASKLCFCTTFKESFAIFDEQIKDLGFKSTLYSYLPKVALDHNHHCTPIFAVSDTFDQHFLQHYLEDGLDQYDYGIRQIIEGNMATIDWASAVKNHSMSEKEKQVFTLASADYRMRNTLTIPCLSGSRGVAGASFITDDNNQHFTLLKKETYDTLYTTTKLFHNHIMSNTFEFSTFVQPLLGPFNQTEKAVLRNLPKGLPVASIANDIGKSVRYTDNVIRNLRIKFGGVDDEDRPNISTARLIYHIGLMSLDDELL